MLGKYCVQVSDVNPPLYEVAVKRVKIVVTKVVRLLDNCSYPEVLMLSSTSNTTSAPRLPMLADLAPAAVPAATLPSAFSKSSSHKSHYPSLCAVEIIAITFTCTLIKSCCTRASS